MIQSKVLLQMEEELYSELTSVETCQCIRFLKLDPCLDHYTCGPKYIENDPPQRHLLAWPKLRCVEAGGGGGSAPSSRGGE